MATYTVWLGNPSGMVFHWKDLCFAVQALFKPALEGNPKFDKALMKRGMQHAYPQWIGGFEASHDPLNGL